MKKIIFVAVALVFVSLPIAQAEEGIIDRMVEGCETEIETYCSQVTPGEGRMLACFYAHGDKISARCEYALYEGAAELEEFIDALSLVATECHDELLEFCGEVEIGEGRVGTCLLEHKNEVSEPCAQAIVDTELEVVED